jgi:nicotinamidase-related amidase/chorismate mutase
MPQHARNALIIIDVQNAIDDPRWGQRNNPHAEGCMRALLDHWRAQRWPIVHLRHESREPNSTYRPGQPGCDFKIEVQPRTGEAVLTKHTNSAFIGTDLHALLRAQDVGSIVICGVITNNSVETTVRMAGNLGYLTYVVSDATATFDMIDFDGANRNAGEVHAMSLANVNREYARVVTTSEVLEGVPAKSAFKECASLEQVRTAIDRIDRDLVALLAERGRYVREAARFKTSENAVRAVDRVEQVIARASCTAADFGADPSVTERVYRAMIEAFIDAELKEWKG